jgi:hypothetical protein
MRGLLVIPSILAVMGLAVWAYQQNYATQAAARDAERLRADIAALRERRALLQAEWAYLNRPDRLAALAEVNFERLGLMPIQPGRVAPVEQVVFPPDPATLIVRQIVETRASGGADWP